METQKGVEKIMRVRQWLKIIIPTLTIIIVMFSFNYGSDVCLAEQLTDFKERKTSVGITFEKNTSVQSDIPPTRIRKNLPSTGELMNSIVLSLIGCSLFVFFVGVYCFKEIGLKETHY